MGFIGRSSSGNSKKGRYILFGSIAGVVIIACVLIICSLFGRKKKEPDPNIPDGYYRVYRIVAEYEVSSGEEMAVMLCEYDDQGNLLTTKEGRSGTGNSEFERISEYTYNGNSRPVLIKTTSLSGDVWTEKREYNSVNQCVNKEITGPDSLETCQYEYDGNGNLLLADNKTYTDGRLSEEMILRYEIRPDGTRSKISKCFLRYDENNNIMSETVNESLLDEKENVISEYRLIGEAQYDVIEYECSYDKKGRLTKYVRKQSDMDDDLHYAEFYQYDKDGNLVSIESWDGVNHYGYDSNGNLIKEYFKPTGETSMSVTDYTKYVYKSFVVPEDLLTDEERDKLGIK